MRRQSTAGRVWPLLAIALLPAMIIGAIGLLQSAELRVPALPKRCVGTVAGCASKLLDRVASERTSVLTFAWVGAGVLLVIGVALAVRMARRTHSGGAGATERERAVLVNACMDVSDVVNGALREQLRDALAEAGVTPVEVAAGERFDSSRHHAVGRVRTDDPGSDNLVAETQRAGYVDRGRRLRYPDVVVFKADGGVR